MSSLAAAQADGFYYPPDYNPAKGGINKQRGSHALGERAKKIKEGIIVIRFELPNNSWCLGCKEHIGRGVRYNAEKKRVGNYHSTPIYEFTMKCAMCPQRFVIRTDPANFDYEFVSGIRKKAERFSHEDNETLQLKNPEERQKLAEDPLARLESQQADKIKAEKEAKRLADVIKIQERQLDDYELNAALRAKNRTHRKEFRSCIRDGQARGIDVPLLPTSIEDRKAASRISFAKDIRKAERSRADLAARKQALKSQSIFGPDQYTGKTKKRSRSEQSFSMAIINAHVRPVDVDPGAARAKRQHQVGMGSAGPQQASSAPAITGSAAGARRPDSPIHTKALQQREREDKARQLARRLNLRPSQLQLSRRAPPLQGGHKGKQGGAASALRGKIKLVQRSAPGSS